MPFTRISLLKGKSEQYLSAVSESLNLALVEALEVPENDFFQIIHQHERNELIFDINYGGGPRSDDFVLFHITTGRPRSAEVKADFFHRLVDRLASNPGIRPEDVLVVISTSAPEDWSFGSGVSAKSVIESAAR
jgi:phenylpyruvate tautomerase PptA (4-oxalocrotonate tautomerase family)